MSDFVIKQGVRLPSLSATLRDDQGVAVDLTSVDGVQFRLRRVGDTDDTFTRAATVLDAATGKVRYDWQVGDTDEAGSYEGEFLVTMSGGYVQSFPGDEFLDIEVSPNAMLDTDDDEYPLIFCTPAQARGIVHSDIPRDTLHLAQTIISLHTGVEPSEAEESYYSTLTDQDITGLRQATAFQAKWLTGQPDYLTRMDVSSESGDGESRNYKANALQLAPLASWALRNTSFAAGEAAEYAIDTPRDRTLYGVPASMEEVGWKPWSL